MLVSNSLCRLAPQHGYSAPAKNRRSLHDCVAAGQCARPRFAASQMRQQRGGGRIPQPARGFSPMRRNCADIRNCRCCATIRRARRAGPFRPPPSPPPLTATRSVEPRISKGRQERIPLAIGYMVASTVLFAFTSAASKWLVDTLSGRRGAVLPRVRRPGRLRGFHHADVRARGVPHRPARRSSAARRFPNHFAEPAAGCVQHDAAGERDRDQLLLAAVCNARIRDLPEGSDRPGTRDGAGGRLSRRADRHQSGRRHVPDRRALRARPMQSCSAP